MAYEVVTAASQGILADLISGLGYLQAVKLDGGGDGVSVPLTGDATFGLGADVRRIALGEGLGTPTFAAISTASSGDQTIVAAVTSKKITVYSYVLVADGTVAVTWKRAATAMSGAMALVVNSGISAHASASSPLFQTGTGEALVLNLSAAIGVRGHLAYVAI
jgi:hypothetical protein